MSVVYNSTLKNARMNAVVTELGSAAYIEIGTTAMGTVLATIALSNPAAPTVTAGVLTFSGTPLSTSSGASATGTAAAARIRKSGAVDVITGLTVGTSGADINLSSVAIVSGETVTITSASITHG